MSKYLFLFLKILKWPAIIIILPVLIYALMSVILAYWGTNPKSLNCKENKMIYISSNGMHIDLILPKSYIDSSFLAQLSPIENTEYYAIGWGDKGFYLETPSWAELKLSVALRAMLIKSPTAMHVTQYPEKDKNWVPIPVCDKQLRIIHGHITETFETNNRGKIIEIKDKGYTVQDRFYEAHGNYTGLTTCNIWVNQALKKASIPTSVWSPFVFGILHHAEKNATK